MFSYDRIIDKPDFNIFIFCTNYSINQAFENAGTILTHRCVSHSQFAISYQLLVWNEVWHLNCLLNIDIFMNEENLCHLRKYIIVGIPIFLSSCCKVIQRAAKMET